MSLRQIDHLVKMANQIALNMAPWGDEKVVAQKTGEHIAKFWTPAMRRQLADYHREGGEGLVPAVARVMTARETQNHSTERSSS